MSTPRNTTRQRLIQAALELFTAHGVTDTTTRQIAELADVNEVTLFRHFGNKHGLLLAAIEEAAVFIELGQTLVHQAEQAAGMDQALKEYATACLEALERVPEMVRSVVGEAGQYPAENRKAIGRGFTQANRYVAQYFDEMIQRRQMQPNLPAETLASLLNGMLLGYAVIEFTSEFHELWQSREEFLTNLVTLFLQGAIQPSEPIYSEVEDLPADTVHLILQRAKKRGLQDYAIAYVLFGAGLSAEEVVQLTRSHYHSTRHQQALHIPNGQVRPLNQWILGKRYGSYAKNPLTQWLKSRKDVVPAMFLNSSGQPITEADLSQRWNHFTEDIQNEPPPKIDQAYPTWCVELLMRGMPIADLQVLTRQDLKQLQPFVDRAREKAALEQAIRLDQPPRIKSNT
ncbi:TetR family transcriptional regulator [Leptolyngbya sp. NIES-2104]|uniref:TetR family transcriptional regulator n=1 Tax=Leptolyngbya sp. NIES-2104 TaxID=1552121 RepID=UPI0006ECC601|nr:TetR family transcriptional regulator [Leptolyngbya sp. NIES-2104]GAP95690.1 transcriptional regulator, TetR family [Leptolyngbya sp. NIES-2104]